MGVGELSQAGPLVRTEGLGVWWVSVPKNQWPEHAEWEKILEKKLGRHLWRPPPRNRLHWLRHE